MQKYGDIYHDACSSGDLQLLKNIFAKGFHFKFQPLGDDETSIETRSGLTNACANGHVEIMNFLLEQGHIATLDSISVACLYGNFEIAQHLISFRTFRWTHDGSSLDDDEDEEYFKGFLFCCRCGSLDTIKCFLNHGLNPNYSFSTKSSPNVDIFDYGDDFCVYDSMTGFEFALLYGNLEVVKFFVNELPDFNYYSVRHCYNETPLHLAARSSNVKLVKFLLDLECFNINAVNELHQTALDIACRGNLEVAKFLFSQGAKHFPNRRKNHLENIFSLVKKNSSRSSILKSFLSFQSWT